MQKFASEVKSEGNSINHIVDSSVKSYLPRPYNNRTHDQMAATAALQNHHSALCRYRHRSDSVQTNVIVPALLHSPDRFPLKIWLLKIAFLLIYSRILASVRICKIKYTFYCSFFCAFLRFSAANNPAAPAAPASVTIRRRSSCVLSPVALLLAAPSTAGV